MAKQRRKWPGAVWVWVVAIPTVILGAFAASHQPNPPSAGSTPSVTVTAPAPTVGLCGAPPNPLGYNYCGGSRIREPSPDTCAYFHCAPGWASGEGYMVECRDGMFSMSGGRPDSCSGDGGDKHSVYQR